MAKETYYFQHDYEPTSDPKIQALINQYGWVGYGLFWRICEMLHSDESHKIPKKKYIFQSMANKETPVEMVLSIIESCVNDFELFVSDGEYFWSERVLRNISNRDESRKNKSKAGKISAEKRQHNSTGVEQVLTDVQQNPTKEKKEKEKKEKETILLEKEPKASNKKIFKVETPKEIQLPFESENFKSVWKVWNEYRWNEKRQRFKSVDSEHTQLKHLFELSGGNESDAIAIINQSIGNQYTGLFQLKTKPISNAKNNGTTASNNQPWRI